MEELTRFNGNVEKWWQYLVWKCPCREANCCATALRCPQWYLFVHIVWPSWWQVVKCAKLVNRLRLSVWVATCSRGVAGRKGGLRELTADCSHGRAGWPRYPSVTSTKLCTSQTTDMRRLTTGIHSEKCVVGRIRRCAKVYLHKPR